MSKQHIEVEGGELAIRNSHGDVAIVPKRDRKKVQKMIDAGCDTCIDRYVSNLPRLQDYAADGSLYPDDPPVKSKNVAATNPMEGTYIPQPITGNLEGRYIPNSIAIPQGEERYIFDDDLNDTQFDDSLDDDAKTFNPKSINEVTFKSPDKTRKCPSDAQCVYGVYSYIANTLDSKINNVRRDNNLYGNAWQLLDNTYGKFIDISKSYDNLKSGDIISLSRESFSSDKSRGIPDKEQHVGVIRREGDDIYVVHYVKGEGYFEEPIDDLKEFAIYTPSRAKRPVYKTQKELDSLTQSYNTKYKDLNFVQRALDPDSYPHIKNNNGTVSSHRMTYSTDDKGNAIVYPMIVQLPDGTLKHFKTNKEAIDYAYKTGEYMEIEDEAFADYYTKNGLIKH